MNALEAIEKRRSVKHFDPQHQLSDEEINTLKKHALYSPTSFNIQNWRFVFVQDKGVQSLLKNASWGQAQVEDASLVIVLCADLQAWAHNPGRYWQDAPKPVAEALVPMIGKFYDNNEPLQRDEAMRSIGIASQTIMIAAKSMGYDTCPMIGFDPNQVAEIIKLPEDHVIGMMVTLGKKIKEPNVRGGQLDASEVIFDNHF